MAEIKIDSKFGYTKIEEKMEALTNDINEMSKRGEISNEGAIWMLRSFREVIDMCRDYKDIAEEKEESHPLSF